MRPGETRNPEVSDYRTMISLLGPSIIVQNHPADRAEVGIVRDQNMVDFIFGSSPRIEGGDGRNTQRSEDMRMGELPNPSVDRLMNSPAWRLGTAQSVEVTPDQGGAIRNS
jgi:hypothetical protein